MFIFNGEEVEAPEGIKVVNFTQEPWIKSEHVVERKHPLTQLIVHRGAETNRNSAKRTKAVLDNRNLSTLFTMDIDGTIYQHFDPALYRGKHCTHHNVQSDSIDVAGVFTQPSSSALAEQNIVTLPVAIGRSKVYNDPMLRKMVPFKYHDLTEAQKAALAIFIPFWCDLRGIEKQIYHEHRTIRKGGLGVKDPVTNLKGVFSHCQVADPGHRVDGVEVIELLKSDPSFKQCKTIKEML